ncbi:MAG TPA: ROK family protein [Clostridia bacterium]|nr:ROK family protein [Clostridia bacterium]
MKAISIDLGGTHATVGLIEDRKILASTELSLNCTQGLAPVLPLFAEAARGLLSKLGIAAEDCEGLALSFCGLADARTGRVVSTNQKYDDATALDLPRWCREALGMRFAIENDARMALLGEWYAGAASDTDDAVMITLGTGIGGAAMMNGKLVRGKHVQGGCLGGHLPVLFSGRRCTCGAIGCTEAEASGWALPLVAKEWPGFDKSALAAEPQINFRVLFEHAKAGDAVATAIRDRCIRIWAAGAVGLIHAYDPEKIIIGGGVMRSADAIIPFIQSYVKEYSWTPWGDVQIVAAQLGNNAGLLGAVPLLANQN